VDNVFETVDRSHFAFTAFVRSSGDENFVVLSDGNRPDLNYGSLGFQNFDTVDFGREHSEVSYIVLFSKFLTQRCTHDHPSNAGRCTEMLLARLPPRGMESYFLVTS
jgi:hypothetical protein